MASLLVKPPVTGLSIRAPSKIYVGQTVNVQVSMIPANADMATVQWRLKVIPTRVPQFPDMTVNLANPYSDNGYFNLRINSNGTGTVTLLRDLLESVGATYITFEATSGVDVYSSVKMQNAQTVRDLTLRLERNDPSSSNTEVLQDSATGVYTVGIGYNVKPVVRVITSDNRDYTGVINWNIPASESSLVVSSSSPGGALVSSPTVLGNMEAVKAGSLRLTYNTFDYRNTNAFIDILVVASPPKVSQGIDQAQSFIYDGNVFVGKTVPAYLCVSPVGATYTNLTWTSSNPAVAFIDSNGNLTGVSVGTYTLTASLTDSTNQQITLISSVQNVTLGIARIGFNQPSLRNLQIAEGTDIGPELLTVKLSNGQTAPDLTKIKFSSSDPKVMTILDNSVIYPVSNGSANLIATAIDGTEVTSSMPVFVETSLDILTLNIPQLINITAGFPIKLVASNTSKAPAYLLGKFWSSSDSSKVSVTQTGVLTGVATGTSVISFMATVSTTSLVTGGNLRVTKDSNNLDNTVKVVYSSTITVTNNVTSILVNPASAAINYLASVKTVTLNANVVPSTAANPNIVWSSSNPAVASIPDSSNQSSVVVTGVSSGTATISATAQDTGRIIGRSVITVGTPIVGVTVNHPTSVTVGTAVQVTYSLTPEGALAESVVWSNSKRRGLIDYGDLTDTGLYVPPATSNIPSNGELQLKSPSVAVPNPAHLNPFTLSVKNQFASDPIEVPLNDFTVRQPVTSLGVSEPVVTVSTTGSTSSYEVAPFLLPTNAFNKTVTWSSMDQSVAVVVAPANGPVTVQGVNAGTAIIRAISADGPVGTLVVNVTAGTLQVTLVASTILNVLPATPTSMVVDMFQNVYVSDATNYIINMYDSAGLLVNTFGTSGQSGFVDGPSSTARFNFAGYASLVAIGGTVYVADCRNGIRMIKSGCVSTLVCNKVLTDPTLSPNAILTKLIDTLYGIAADGSGNLYVADVENLTILKVPYLDGVYSDPFVIAGGVMPQPATGVDNTIGTSASFRYFSNMIVNGSTLYIPDPDTSRIRKIDLSSSIYSVSSSSVSSAINDLAFVPESLKTYGIQLDGSSKAIVSLNRSDFALTTTRTVDNQGAFFPILGPSYLTTDIYKNLYVLDVEASPKTVNKITIPSATDAPPFFKVSTVFSNTTSMFSAGSVGGMAVVSNDIYLVNKNKYVVYKITNGTATVYAGIKRQTTLSTTDYSDGKFSPYMSDIVYSKGFLYVCDGMKIVKVDIPQTGLTIASLSLFYDGTTGTTTIDDTPIKNMVADSDGNFYISNGKFIYYLPVVSTGNNTTGFTYSAAPGSLVKIAGSDTTGGVPYGPALSVDLTDMKSLAIDIYGVVYTVIQTTNTTTIYIYEIQPNVIGSKSSFTVKSYPIVGSHINSNTYISDISIDGGGLVATDSGNSVILLMGKLNGNFSNGYQAVQIAGLPLATNLISVPKVDGPVTQATFYNPSMIRIGSSEDWYVLDSPGTANPPSGFSNYNLIRRIKRGGSKINQNITNVSLVSDGLNPKLSFTGGIGSYLYLIKFPIGSEARIVLFNSYSPPGFVVKLPVINPGTYTDIQVGGTDIIDYTLTTPYIVPTPTTVPATPTNLRVLDATSTTITISWEDSSDEASYMYDLLQGSTRIPIDVVPGPNQNLDDYGLLNKTATFKNLTPLTTYGLGVLGSNGPSLIGRGIKINGTTLASTVSLVPDVPSVSIDTNIPGSITSDSITISWTADVNASSYNIVVSELLIPSNTVPVSFPAFGLGNDPGSFRITGLKSYTEYDIKMYNSDMSNYKEISNDAKTASNVPAAPVLAPGTVTSSSIQVTWTANSSATSYNFSVLDSNSNVVDITFPAFSAGQDPGTFTFMFSNPQGSNVFYYTVTIFNSDNSNSKLINVPLFQPQVLGSPSLSETVAPVSVFTSNSITLNWAPVLYATSYGVYYSTSTPTNTAVLPNSVNPLQNSTYTEVLFTNATDPRTFTIGGSSSPLSSGTYHIWMWSYNSNSTTSNPNSSTTPTYLTIDISQTAPPTQLASPTLNPGTTTNTTFTLYWTPVSNATSYGLYYTTSNPGAQTVSLPTTVNVDNSTTFTPVPFVGSPQTDPGTVTIGSLNSNATYYVWIWSYNSNSTTNPNSSTTPTYLTINIPPSTQLASPQLDTPTTTDTTIRLTWPQTPTGAVKYKVLYGTSNPPTRETFVMFSSGDPLSYEIIGLRPYTDYYVEMRSVNSADEESSATPVQIQTQGVRITSIVNGSLTRTVNGQEVVDLTFTVNWTATSKITAVACDVDLLSSYSSSNVYCFKVENSVSVPTNSAYTANFSQLKSSYITWTGNNTTGYSGTMIFTKEDTDNYKRAIFAGMGGINNVFNTNMMFILGGQYMNNTTLTATADITRQFPDPPQAGVAVRLGPPTTLGFTLEPLSVTASTFTVYLIETVSPSSILTADQIVSNCDPSLTKLSLYGTAGGSSTDDLLGNMTLSEALTVDNGYIESLDLNYNRTITYQDSTTQSFSYYASAKIVLKNLMPYTAYRLGGSNGYGLTLLKNIYGTVDTASLMTSYITTTTLNMVAPIRITDPFLNGNIATISWKGGNMNARYNYYLNGNNITGSISNDYSNAYNPHVDVDVQISSGTAISNSIYITAQMFDSQGAAFVDSNGQIIPAVRSNTVNFNS